MREDTVRGAALLREARLRAGFSQQELAETSGKDRTVIARYEQGVVAPSIDTLVELYPGPDEQIREIQMLSPDRRVDRLIERRGSEAS